MIRLLIAVGLSAGISLVGTKYLIEWLTRHRIGQPIRDDGPDGHKTKAGTPTKGGVAIVAGAAIAYVVSDLYNGIYTRTGIFVMLAIIGGGAVGLLDDWIKVVRERNLGLNKQAKMLGFQGMSYVHRYPECWEIMFGWAAEGKMVYKADTLIGIENCVDSLNSLFTGANTGKAMVQITPDPGPGPY